MEPMRKIFFICGCVFLCSCYASKNPLRAEVKQLQNGDNKNDTSYVYALPFEKGKTFRVIQGYFSQFSHKERAALDFNMKPGARIAAAREGIVIRVKEDGDRGGFKKKYRPYGNHIVIEHADGSRAGYWHLQKDGALVKVGDTVKRGQVIALSGQTGYAAVPHLHFLVWRSDANKRFQQVPTRFETAKGIKYLKFWKKYKNAG
jgi:murein DD-endopeptidase MepM/ murein hydrolase activator NlpD